MKIKCIVLTTGQELIGEVTSENDQSPVTINEAAQVAMVPGKTSGEMGYAIIPWLPYGADGNFTIGRQHILTMFDPTVDMINYYNRVIGSGIQIASAGVIKQ